MERTTLERWSRWCDVADRASRAGLLAAGLAVVLVVTLAIAGVWASPTAGIVGWLSHAATWAVSVLFFGGIGVAIPSTLMMMVATWRLKRAASGAPSDHLPPMQGERFGDMRCVVITPDLVSFVPTNPHAIRMAWRIALLALSAVGITVMPIALFHVVGFLNVVKVIGVFLTCLAIAPFALSEFSAGWDLRRIDGHRTLRLRRSSVGRANRWSEVPMADVRRVESREGALGFWTVSITHDEAGASDARVERELTLATFGSSKDHARWQADRLVAFLRRWLNSDHDPIKAIERTD
jgi:hypothetical protein